MPRNEIYCPPCLLGACPHPGTLTLSPEGRRCPRCNAVIFPKALVLVLAAGAAR